MPETHKKCSILTLNTTGFTACFMGPFVPLEKKETRGVFEVIYLSTSPHVQVTHVRCGYAAPRPRWIRRSPFTALQ